MSPTSLRTPKTLTLRQVMDLFEGTGITAPSSIPMDSTAHIPTVQDLEGRKGTDITGEAQFQVLRMPGRNEDFDPIIVATADPLKGDKAFPDFMRVYASSTPAERAQLLGNQEWVECQRQTILQAIAAPSQSPSGYTSKVQMKPTTSSPEVQVGESEAGKKRLTWNGHSGFSLARWMGAQGFTGSEAKKVFALIHLPMGETAIIGGVYAGKAGKRGTPAQVTPPQAKILMDHLSTVRSTTAKAPVVETPAPTPTPTPTPTPVVEAPKPLVGLDRVTGKGSKRKAKNQKLAQAMMDRKIAKAKK